MPALLIAAWLFGAPASAAGVAGPAHPGLAPWSVSGLVGETSPGGLRAFVEHRGDSAEGAGQCAALVDEICRRASPKLCESVRREAERRPATEEDQRACRAILDDPARLSRLIRGASTR